MFAVMAKRNTLSAFGFVHLDPPPKRPEVSTEQNQQEDDQPRHRHRDSCCESWIKKYTWLEHRLDEGKVQVVKIV